MSTLVLYLYSAIKAFQNITNCTKKEYKKNADGGKQVRVKQNIKKCDFKDCFFAQTFLQCSNIQFCSSKQMFLCKNANKGITVALQWHKSGITVAL